MKNQILYLKAILFLTLFLLNINSSLISQIVCQDAIHLDENQRQILGNRFKLSERSTTVKLLVIYRNVPAHTTSFTISGAIAQLNTCASATTGFNVNYDVTIYGTNIDWSSNPDASMNLTSLMNSANALNLYNIYDVIIGVTDLNITYNGNTGVAGVAYLGSCGSQPSSMGPALIMENNVYNAVLSHELGHTLGMDHDDTDMTITDHTKSLMNPVVYSNANTMSTANKSCYRTSAGGTPLPVELTSFTGKIEYAQTHLTWKTATEINNNGFYIERGIDALKFEEVSFVKGYGNTNIEQTYNYTEDIKSIRAPIVYYRLRQEDFDGTITYSKVIALENNKHNVVLKAFPNPSKDIVKLEFTSDVGGESLLQLTDIAGRVLLEKNIAYTEGYVLESFDLKDIANGLYFIKKIDNQKEAVLKFIKN